MITRLTLLRKLKKPPSRNCSLTLPSASSIFTTPLTPVSPLYQFATTFKSNFWIPETLKFIPIFTNKQTSADTHSEQVKRRHNDPPLPPMYEKRAPPYQENKVQRTNDSFRLYSFSNIVHELFETHHVSKRNGPPHPMASLCTTTPPMYK